MTWPLVERIGARLRHHGQLGIERTLLYCANPGDPRLPAVPLPTGARMALLGHDQLTALGDIGPCDVAECRERLARGDLAYCVWIGDELAHYSWVQRSGVHPIDAADLGIPVRAGEIWIYNCRTSERRRGNGIYPAVLRLIVDEHLRAGSERVWIYTSHTNVASQRGIARAGFRGAGVLHALRFGAWFHRL